MKVLHVIGGLQTSHGGPSRSVPRLAAALTARGISSAIVHAPFSEPNPPEVDAAMRAGVRITPWNGAASLTRNEADVVHLHGIWSPLLHAIEARALRSRIPVIVSPRGMLTPWARNHHKWRKRAAWLLYQRRDLDRAAILHATSTGEADHIRQLGFRQRVEVIPNGTDVPSRAAAFNDERRLLFLSRIHAIKGIGMLVDAVRMLKEPLTRGRWKVFIVGPAEPGEREALVDRVTQLGVRDLFTILDAVEGEEKWDMLRSAQVLVLPSFSENFGLIVAEALATGVPVITTTATPWKDITTRDCGWCVVPESKAITEAVSEASQKDPVELQAMGEKGRRWMEADYSWASVAARFQPVYESLGAEAAH